VEEGTRREFLELATLLGAGVVLAGGATGLVIGAGAGQAGATPPAGKLTREELAVGRLADAFKIQTSGPTDFHVQHVVLQPGADSGWHTHPGIAPVRSPRYRNVAEDPKLEICAVLSPIGSR